MSSGVHFGSFGGSLSAILEALGPHWATIGGPARPRLIFSQLWLPFGVHVGSILVQEMVTKDVTFMENRSSQPKPLDLNIKHESPNAKR